MRTSFHGGAWPANRTPSRAERARFRASAIAQLPQTPGAFSAKGWRPVAGGVMAVTDGAAYRPHGGFTVLMLPHLPGAAVGRRFARIQASGPRACWPGPGDILTADNLDGVVLEVLGEVRGATRLWPFLPLWSVREKPVAGLKFPASDQLGTQRDARQRKRLIVLVEPQADPDRGRGPESGRPVNHP